MTETPDPEEQNQEQPEAAADRVPASPADAAGAQNGSTPPAADEAAQAGTDEPVPTGEQEDADLDEGEKPQPAGPDQEEAVRRKERLEKQARWQAEFSSEQERVFNQRANQRRIEFDRRQIGLRRIEESDLRQNELLFVPPEGYQEFVERIEQSTGTHILIVSGPEHSGKLTTAIYLAHHLWPKKAPDVFLFADLSIKTLLNVVADEQLPGNAVLLFDEVFDRKQLMVDDLVNRYAHLKEDLIERGNVWFLFTMLPGPDLDALAASNFPILDTSTVDREQVLEKLIDFFFPAAFGNQRTMLLEARAELNPELTPPDLYNLFESYRQNVPQLCKNLTKEEQERQLAPNRWFQDLPSMNYQLYALLVVLFDKLDMPTLEEIYTVTVNALRQQGLDGPDEFIDPRRIGTNLMHSKLGIGVRFNVLEFRNRIYRQYVEAQIENFHRLLWSLIDPDDPSTFTGLIGVIPRLSKNELELARRSEKDERSIASSDQLRYAIAVMIAQVGVYHLPKLELLLDKLVRDESALVSLTAAFVLAEIARRDENFFDFIEKLLKIWCQSGRFEQMWTAAASIANIYEAIARNLKDELVPLTEEDEQDEEREEERKVASSQDQKQRGKEYLARLQDLLTELVKMHDRFSEETVQEARHAMYGAYRERLRQQFEAASEPMTDNAQFFVFLDKKRTIDEAVNRLINVLTDSWKNQMRMVLVQSLEQMAQRRPRDITRLIHVWLDRNDTKDPLWQIGHQAHTEIAFADYTDKNQDMQKNRWMKLMAAMPEKGVISLLRDQIQETRAVKIFYCYARKDKLLRDELGKHLAVLERSGQVITWCDRKILPGTEWKNEIGVQLDTADIILLLISPNFIQSDYCYSVEMQRALERHRARAVYVIPVILRPCDWKAMPIHALQALPENGKPISKWHNRDDAFQNIVKGIRQVIDAFYFTPYHREESGREAQYKEMIMCPYCLTIQELRQTTSQCNNPECGQKLHQKYRENAHTGNLTCLGTFGPLGHGKTAFLSSLMQSALAVHKIVPGSYFRAFDDYTQKKLNEWSGRYRDGQVYMGATRLVERPQPLLVMSNNFPVSHPNILVAYDLAGEALERAGSQPEYMRALSQVNTIWYAVSLVDLVNHHDVGYLMDGLFNVYQNAMAELHIPIKGKNILVVYTKADLLLGVERGLEPLPREVVEYLATDPYDQLPEKLGSELPAFDEDAYFAKMTKISDILLEYTIDFVYGGGAFVSMVRDAGMQVYFTSNSAYGGALDSKNRLGPAVHSIRVLDALIWAIKLNSGK